MSLSIEWVGDKGGGMGGKDGLYSSIQSCCKPGKRSNNSSTTGKGGVNGFPSTLSLSLEKKRTTERESSRVDVQE